MESKVPRCWFQNSRVPAANVWLVGCRSQTLVKSKFEAMSLKMSVSEVIGRGSLTIRNSELVRTIRRDSVVERAHEYQRQHRAITDISEVAQRAKGRNLSNNTNCLPTNTSTFEEAIHSIKITRL